MYTPKAKLLIQVDCDSETAIRNHYHTKALQTRYAYYSALDLFLQKFREHHIRATLFVVGSDMKDDFKRHKIEKAMIDGHEIANHTFTHPSNLSKLSMEDLAGEIVRTNDIFNQYFGIRPQGFRAPNFDMNSRLLALLYKERFEYDCSLLSTPFKPLLKLIKKENPFQSGYLGQPRLYPSPRQPYIPQPGNLWRKDVLGGQGKVMEFPVQTLPYLHVPCNFSYLLAMPERIGRVTMKFLINWHRKKGEPFFFIFHLADLVDNRHLLGTEASFYQGIKSRTEFLDEFFQYLADDFLSETTGMYCCRLKEGNVEKHPTA